MKKLFIDTETTGTEPLFHGLIELSGIVEINGKEEEEFTFNCSLFEGDEIDREAEKKHGFSEEEINRFPDPVEIYHRLIEVFDRYVDRYDRKDKFLFLGYGAEFDNNFLRSFFEKVAGVTKIKEDKYFGSWFFSPWIDVMSLAANALKTERYRMENFKQGTVAEFVRIDVEKSDLHGSAYDIRLTKQLYDMVEDGSILSRVRAPKDVWEQRVKNRGKRFRKDG